MYVTQNDQYDKRVALCLSGQPRSFAEAYPYIKKNIIDSNPNVDVFIHCWYDEKEIGQKFKNTSDSVREGGLNIVEAHVPQQLIELYKPKLHMFEKQEDFSHYVKPEYIAARDKTQPFATFSMWTSIYKCNELKRQYESEQSFIYDVVIKGRFDLALETPVTVGLFSDYSKLITAGPIPESNIIADILFFTSSSNMDKIARLVQKLDDYFIDLKKWNNETFLYHHTRQQDIIEEHYPEIKFHLIRGKRTLIDTIWYYSKRVKQKIFQ